MKKPAIEIPEGLGGSLLLHACCAPCSSAIVEWLVQHDIRPIIFYYNPNIFPREEYEIRKTESKRHAESLGIRWIDGDYDHERWLMGVCGLEDEPERGQRCRQCFTLRLTETAKKAKELGLAYFATTLASSRWKSLEQIEQAGQRAEQSVPGTCFWAQNWRKGGLQDRRNQLLKTYNFYNQQYCGCEFSVRQPLTKEALRSYVREAKKHHSAQFPRWSEAVGQQLGQRLADSKVVMAYWPLPDEVDIRPLINRLVAKGKTVLLPKVTGDTTMELRRYTSVDDLREGAFRIMEPIGSSFTDYDRIDTVLVPGMAFDAAGHRLGRGRGYYDRFLSAHPGLHKIGVCFPFQRVDQVPTDPHDIRMDEVVVGMHEQSLA